HPALRPNVVLIGKSERADQPGQRQRLHPLLDGRSTGRTVHSHQPGATDVLVQLVQDVARPAGLRQHGALRFVELKPPQNGAPQALSAGLQTPWWRWDPTAHPFRTSNVSG